MGINRIKVFPLLVQKRLIGKRAAVDLRTKMRFKLARDMLKDQVKRVLPALFYQRAAAIWRLRKHSGWLFKYILAHGCPETLLYFGIAPGDDLLCTTVLRELRKRGQKKVWMMSNHPDLFKGNDDVQRIVPIDQRVQDYVKLFGKRWRFLEYAKIEWKGQKSLLPERHIIAELCARSGIQGPVDLRPYLYLSDEERKNGGWAKGKIAIQSSGLAAKWPMQNKEWFPERFQEVVNRLKDRFKFVQIGSANDPILEGATDLRGKTSIRETGAVLANCRLYIGGEGFLMHLARAVECPSVVILGGRTAPWQFCYSCNINLYSALPCSPCGLWNDCDYNRDCMRQISATDATEAVLSLLERPRNPLAMDIVKI